MQKRKKGRKFHRKSDQRKALFKSLARELFLKEKIKTTEAKAKEISRLVEKQISHAKSATLASRRRLLRSFSPSLVKKIIEEIAPRYKARPGGYTRIIKLEMRKSDGSKMAIIELLK